MESWHIISHEEVDNVNVTYFILMKIKNIKIIQPPLYLLGQFKILKYPIIYYSKSNGRLVFFSVFTRGSANSDQFWSSMSNTQIWLLLLITNTKKHI